MTSIASRCHASIVRVWQLVSETPSSVLQPTNPSVGHTLVYLSTHENNCMWRFRPHYRYIDTSAAVWSHAIAHTAISHLAPVHTCRLYNRQIIHHRVEKRSSHTITVRILCAGAGWKARVDQSANPMPRMSLPCTPKVRKHNINMINFACTHGHYRRAPQLQSGFTRVESRKLKLILRQPQYTSLLSSSPGSPGCEVIGG